jgi:hypothetical protein
MHGGTCHLRAGGLFLLQRSREGSLLRGGLFVFRKLCDLVCRLLLLLLAPCPSLFRHELVADLLQGRRRDKNIENGGVNGLLVPFENAFPRTMEGLEDDTLLRCAGGTKGVYTGVFFLPDSTLVLSACRGTWTVSHGGGLADLGPSGERGGGRGRRGRRPHGYICVSLTKSPTGSFYRVVALAGKH